MDLFPGGPALGNLPANLEDVGSILVLEDPDMPPGWLGLCAATTEARVPGAHALTLEKPSQREV